MNVPVNWSKVNSVFLDMDGTILDLYFDNYFWHEHVPFRYSQKNKMHFQEAKKLLKGHYKSKSGTLEWYCIEYWSDVLELDIADLKREIANKVNMFPNVKSFLLKLKQMDIPISLVTNAHRTSVQIKFDVLGLEGYFSNVVSSHDYGNPKEDQIFWEKFMKDQPFDKSSTLFIDDNLSVLSAAERYGITNLITIKQPDSTKPHQDTKHFDAIAGFDEIMPA